MIYFQKRIGDLLMSENGKPHILIADFDAENIAALSALLHAEYSVGAVKKGDTVCKTAAADKPDLILLDIETPYGFEVLAKLKETEETRAIPVILITEPENAEKGLRQGAADYVTKPFSGCILQARVETHIKIVNQTRIIEQLGMIDALTNIPNKRAFDFRIKEEWNRNCRRNMHLSLLMIDVDEFAAYNDAYGYPQGDSLLRFAAKILTDNIKRPTDMAARIGGEKFAVLLADTDAEGALLVAESIRIAAGEGTILCKATGEPTSATVSIGLNSLIPTMDLEQISSFIEQANKNLHTAKLDGRNRVVSTALPD
ncbi:hypothetical protein AGMMS49975_11680 [Clostridia bacterium]|nr:hypothetical protein AGMMS49975_11680 [Clostridia bacterium]